MYPAPCDYVRAASAREAVDLLARHDNAKLLAGGHSLIPMMKLRLAQPATLIDIGRIAELRGIAKNGNSLSIGALTTHAELAASELVRAECPLLAEAAAQIGDPQVRNKGTIGGNLAHADPASDLPAVVVALDATLHIEAPGGARSVHARDFFTGLLESAVGEDEILTAIEVPSLGGAGSAYLKVEHPASGYAVCGAAAIVAVEKGACSRARLAFNGIGATPVDAEDVGQALVGTACDDATIASAVAAHLAIDEPLGDIHASGEYRAALAAVYGRRALAAARDRAAG